MLIYGSRPHTREGRLAVKTPGGNRRKPATPSEPGDGGSTPCPPIGHSESGGDRWFKSSLDAARHLVGKPGNPPPILGLPFMQRYRVLPSGSQASAGARASTHPPRRRFLM
jgi:hypothetical protein